MPRTQLAPLLFAALPLLACGKAMDMGPAPPPGDTRPGQTWHMTPFTLQPGEEKIECQYFPPDGKEHWVSKFTTDLSPGSHHLVVFRVSDAQGKFPAAGPSPCSQLDVPQGFDGMLPGSQQRHAEVPMPAGVVMKIETYHGLLFQQHYINAGTTPLTTDVTWHVDEIDPAQVQQAAGMIFYSQWDVSVPPGQSQSAQACLVPADLHLVTSAGHMHEHGKTFDAALDGKAIYHSDTWSDPPITLYPGAGLPAPKGAALSWTCAYDNPTDKTLTFGNSAVNNEMCIYIGIYYPSRDGGTLFDCMAPPAMGGK